VFNPKDDLILEIDVPTGPFFRVLAQVVLRSESDSDQKSPHKMGRAVLVVTCSSEEVIAIRLLQISDDRGVARIRPFDDWRKEA
jgi:hypothetical protein